MTPLSFKFIGWCHDPVNNHDKVWGAIKLDDNWFSGRVLIFWGRRGKKLQTKIDTHGVALDRLIWKKIASGYTEIKPEKLEVVYPEFYRDLETTTIMAVLKI